ncbi:MAG: sulfotransferase family protein [Egibacteraceae bacterium]
MYLFSLPRSGSTLLQRILGSHSEISTASEPYFLLPYLYSLREHGVYAEYDHGVMVGGVKGFCGEYLPRGVDGYLTEVRRLALRLYEEAGNGERYFLDKTPRYHHISSEIISLFPDGRFIFLWRNPIAIAASMMQTWAGGRWNLQRFSADLFGGLPAMVESCEAHRDRIEVVRYEDLLSEPELVLKRLFSYLDLPFEEEALARFSQLPMRNREYWDPTGAQQYHTISTEPLEKWKRTMANPVRKLWSRRYLEWLGRRRLHVMGYDLGELHNQIAAIPTSPRYLCSDAARNAKGFVTRPIRARLLNSSLPMWPHGPGL